MTPENLETFQRATELYRIAWSDVLGRLKGAQASEVESSVEDLKEALLDLKQATIDLDPARVAKYNDEVQALLVELLDYLS